MTPAQHTRDLARMIQALCRPNGEREWVEYKRNHADPARIGQYFSALANAAALNEQPRGYLIWGVEDGTGKPVGTTFDPQSAKKGNEPLENWLLRLLEPRVHFEFSPVEVEGKHIVVAAIERATNVPVQFQGVDYIRIGSVTKPLREAPERERALWRIFDRAPFERRAALGGMTPADALALLNWSAYFNLLNLPVQDPVVAVDTLRSDKMLWRDDANGWGVTNLGAILLAEDLRNFPALQRKAVRVIQYPGKSRIETTRERVFQSGYASGFEQLTDYVDALLPAREIIADAIREDVPAFPRIAVRELVANMLIHQDLAVTGAGPMVEIFADRIEISNPGESLVETDRMIDAPPQSRNEDMAAIMRRFGICEERGSGIDKAMLAIERAQLPAALFETPPGATRVVLFAQRSLRDMLKRDRIRAVYQHACLRYVMGERTTNATLRERFDIPSRNAAIASRLLGDALEAGVIVVEDQRAGLRSRAYLPFWAAPAENGFGDFI